MTARKINEIKIKDHELNRQFPKFQQPKICGYFSLDHERKYVPDSSNLKYFYPPSQNRKIYFDLNIGIEKCIKKPDNLNEKLDHLLLFIKNNLNTMRSPENEKKLIDADFVCYRGLLTHMMDSIYHYERWSVLVTKWKGTLYLSEIKNEPTYNISKEKMDMFSSWGYKFEQFMFSDKFDTPPDINKPVNENEEFCVAFSTKLNNKKILYGAEIDGVISNRQVTDPITSWDGIEFVEVKTSRKIMHPKQEYNLRRHKFIKWWGQSFLVGIKKLYCGFKDDKGIVKNVQEYFIKDLAKNAHEWNASIAMNLCDQFLQVIKDNIPISDDPKRTWRTEFIYRNGDYFVDIYSSNDFILPNWYTDTIVK